MMKLMAYADGELEGAEREEVEAWLEADPDALRFVRDLGRLGELVNEGHAASTTARAVTSFDVADAVMDAALRAERAAPIASLEARRQKNLRTGGGIVVALALAASVFLVMRPKAEVPLAKTTWAPSPAALASTDPGVEVEPAESQGESVQVFYLANESSPTTSVVVWVDEHGAK
jgi:anti-sigma factor RsiW